MDYIKFQTVDLSKYICPIPGVKVLVVDANLTFLAAVSKMLHSLGYEVVTASLASEALSIVEEKKNELNLVFLEVHLPDMDINALTGKIREISDVPYFLMTADDDLFNLLQELCNGSIPCFKKPIKISDLSGMWKYAMWKKDGRIASENIRGSGRLPVEESIVNNSQERHPFVNTGRLIPQSSKRKAQGLKIGGEQSESLVPKRKRLSWRNVSRTKFLGAAVDLAGINATPNQRHRLKNVLGPKKGTSTNYSQRSRRSSKKTNPIKQHSDYKGHRPQLHNHKFCICNCMYLHSLRTQTPNLASLFSTTWTLEEDALYRPLEQLGVAYYTSGSGDFMNNGNGSADISQVENAADGKVFNEDACVYHVNDLAVQTEMDFSTLLANDMSQEFPPLLPVPLLTSDEEHGNSGAEAAKIDETFYALNGTQKFSDEDLKIWLSSGLQNDAVA
ncbi:two-component response regulator ARR2 [Cajanus cajan]|uniref:two-component response regulator ARR2 n=1 Tax=Cajanus cajan TaxID=3821 RepID=UPI00098DCA83|nr:two-component response regulator ARR2 [Cajanus cajan]XP_020216318.1 two-component response regulator ARR2 [Cajanus cajan]XP_029127684.1 two-component response regulator ARR2 [Cajanus cajan]XP_029127686.1 two-component response regulator ARR2 [Cajanus cajan]